MHGDMLAFLLTLHVLYMTSDHSHHMTSHKSKVAMKQTS